MTTVATNTATRASGADVWHALARPLDDIFQHGPGITMRQYNALRRWFSGTGFNREATMADLLGMDVLAQHALGPCPFSETTYDDIYANVDRAVIHGWRDYWLRDGLDDVYGLSWKSAHEVRAAILAWFDEVCTSPSIMD